MTVPLPTRNIAPGEHRGLYIAGPMTGIADHNYPAFAEATAYLRGRGFDVVNPAELHDNDTSRPFDWYLRRDLTAMLTCTGIVLLPGWARSKGASLEYAVAYELGMDTYSYRNGKLHDPHGRTV